jgi:queuine tRNA-ribosyltransferase
VDFRVATPLAFRLLCTDRATSARRGELVTPHGAIQTPAFMPVGTVGSVKAVGPDDLVGVGAQVVLGNTYHLMLRPGAERVQRLGGLHAFMAWNRPILTDSGGFQVFSLGETRKISEEGVAFQSHLDGSRHFLTPESSIQIQEMLGADIIMAFDECPPAGASSRALTEAVDRTSRWLARCVAAWKRGPSSLFGIVQGGLDVALRRRHVEEVCAFDLPGYALGGFSVGEEPAAMHEGVARCAPMMPADKPRYLMGVGTPVDLLTCIGFGIDMFDCVLPTRCARNGLLFTSQGRLVIKNQAHVEDNSPVDPCCTCYTCKTFSRAYLRHLFVSREILAMRLNTLHNLHYFLSLMKNARDAIERGTFESFRKEALKPYLAGNSEDVSGRQE